MAFKRNSAKSLVSSKRENFAYTYKFSKKANFKDGSDVYVIALGLEDGFYETPCHKVNTHKVDGKTLGFNGSVFSTYIKCEGIDSEGNLSESLCCTLAKLEKERFPEANDAAKRIVSSRTTRIHIPVLILGNSLNDDSKISYPISKVALKKDLASESGLKFAYLDMSAYTFKTDIINAYGKKLKEDGNLDYELDENTEEFMEEVLKRLTSTVIKVHWTTKAGFVAAMREYSFFPFSNPAIANASGEGERELIINYKKNDRIVQQVSEFMTLFDAEVDNIIGSWSEKDLQEYYNSAIGADLKTPIGSKTKEDDEEEVVFKSESPEVKEPEAVKEPIEETSKDISMDDPVNPIEGSVSDEQMASILSDPFGSETKKAKETVDELADYEFDADGDEGFFDE